MRELIGQQGEVLITKIDNMPVIKSRPVEKITGGFIISHSERGNHHMLSGGEVVERISDVPSGMRILYALIEGPEKFFQDGPVPHKPYHLVPGIYEFRISREYSPFTEQARIVAD